MELRKRKRYKKRNDKTDPFYQSRSWRTKRREIILRDKGLCQECLREGRVNGDLKTVRTVDHIKPINQGGAPLDNSNLELLCDTHHARKSQSEIKK